MKHTIWIDEDQFRKLEHYCEVCDRSLAQAIREALADFLPVVADTRIQAVTRRAKKEKAA